MAEHGRNYSKAMELKKEAEMSEERLKSKRKHEEIQDLVSKKKKKMSLILTSFCKRQML